MKAEKKTFVMSLDWYETIQECSDEEKAWLLDAIYKYQLYGQMPQTKDRFLRATFMTMQKFFDYNSEKYEEKKIQNSLNQQKRWAQERKDTASVEAIEERKRFLKSHSLAEYTDVYGRIQMYTDNDNDSDNENDYESDNDSDIESENENESVYESVYEYESEGLRERKQVSLPELQQYHDEHGYTFDCRNAFNAMTKPLYKDELQAKCNFWENIPKR